MAIALTALALVSRVAPLHWQQRASAADWHCGAAGEAEAV